METQLLATKLFVPQPRPGLVPRPRLIEQLNSALDSPFTLVSAPAGFGKTTILTQWINTIGRGTPVGWVQLDEGDNDPVRFWDYFIGGVRKYLPDAGQAALSMLHAPQAFGTNAVLASLLNDLADIHTDLLLVIDDYHLIKSEAIHATLSYLVEHCPPRLHLIVATRVDPMMPLAHFRGRGTMIEVGADDLRFTSGEADEFLRAHGVELDREDLTRLNAKAEGWAVGIKMAATAMRGRKDLSEFIAAFAGNQRYIMDYLIEEVLSNQQEGVRSFLLTTSILQKMTSRLCDAVTGRSDGRESLAQLEQSNLFLVPLDDSRHWFRYHHLFADLLRHELHMEKSREEVQELHRRASQWYGNHDLVDDAIHHAIEAADWERAFGLVRQAADEKTAHGSYVTLINWIKSIPEELRRSNLPLYLQYGRALAVSVQTDEAKAVLDYLEEATKGDSTLLGEVLALQTSVASASGQIARVVELGREALALLPASDLGTRAWVSYEVGFVLYNQGSLDEASGLLSDALEMSQESGDSYIAATSATFLAAIAQLRGELGRGWNMANTACRIAGESPGASLAYCRRCFIAYERNDLQLASESARLIIQWSNYTGKAETPLLAQLYQALILLARGEVDKAAESMQEADRLAPRAMPYFRAIHAAFRVLFAVRQGHLDDAGAWAGELQRYADVCPFQQAHVIPRLLVAQGKKHQAQDMLRSVYDRSMNSGANGFAIEVRVCQALAADTEEDALAFLSEALVKAQPEGYVRTFVDEGKLLAPLLRKAESRGIVPAYTARLLRTIHDEEQRHGVVMLNSRGFPLSGPLSERELEILRLLETGLSNRQIANRLVITLSTAKTHIHNISRKLDANTRTQAIARAREMKLI